MDTIPFVVPSEHGIKARFRQLIFGVHPRCPRCQRQNVRVVANRYHCRSCRRKFSLTSGTWLAGMKLSWTQLWILLWCFCHRYQPRQAASLAEVTLKSARTWYGRFRTQLPERGRVLRLHVVADEGYFGKRRTGNQRIVAGALEPRSKEVRLRMIPDTEQDSIERFLWDHVSLQTMVWTDAHKSYGDIAWMGYGHDWEIHERGQFGKTSPIERVWSFSKWLTRRMYHHVWAENLPHSLREIEWRFSAPGTFASPLTLAEILLRPVPRSD
ncbi:MAG: hypothetical protein G01um101438_835 [Parcubacteria group bacterium Gr01-1014_38]|nr:MAG: hypothetical protein G01um101438_835 [Parcubacteria group bacterium Gr01-1014_38]